jgi:phosphate starvation-inducible PhoH-like protein
MSEKIFSLEGINPVDFYGFNDKNIEIIRNSFPKLKVISRGDTIKIIGDDNVIQTFETKFNTIVAFYEKFGKISENDIVELLDTPELYNKFESDNDILVHGRNGLLIKARTENQLKMVELSKTKDLIFAIGPAGTGKTYTAVAIAVKALKNKEVKRIILTRPAVEAGENLGFLPGDLRDKLDPYLQPLYDALRDMIPAQKLLQYWEDGTIEIAPLAFMRGRTLDNSFVILDEAQNATESQMKMFLTRMGKAAKFIVTGDITQIDLPRNQSSGLKHSIKILENIPEIAFIYLNEKDIIRHKLVSKIIKAYSSK